MTVLGMVVAGVLFLLGILHAYWGFGGLWPGSDPHDLARRVAGFADRKSVQSPFACFVVAAALFYSGVIALVLGGVIPSPIPFFLLGPSAFFITVAFVGRGIAGFTPAWRRRTPLQPFARLDRLFYSPLCLLIGVGFFTLGIRGFSA